VSGPSEHDYIVAFRDAMSAGGVPYSGEIIADGELHRIHVTGDKRGSRNGWLLLHIDERPAGAFGTWKGLTHKWTAEGLREMSAQERAEFARKAAEKRASKAAEEAARNAAAAALATSMWEAATDVADHPYLARKGVPSFGLRVGDYVKEFRPGADGVARQKRFKGALLIPLRDTTRAITSLQAVFPESTEISGQLRDKDFVYGGRKEGCFFTIGKPTERDGVLTVVVVEGYATGASVHIATGLAVIVAFDSGNLLPVARAARRLMPDARIVIAGDNDLWTRKPTGEAWNPGVEKGMAAAIDVEGLFVAPRFASDEGKPTDFNDLHQREGIDAVERQVLAALAPAPAAPADFVPPWDAVNPDNNGQEGPPPAVDEDDEACSDHFRVLGHDRDNIHVYQYRLKLIQSRPMTAWSESALITLAPLQWWEREFPKAGGGINTRTAHNWLMRMAERKGFFDPNCRRGRGAWHDDGRVVYHFGDRLLIDGVMQDGLKIDSSNVYEQSGRLRLPSNMALTSSEAKVIFTACEAFHWTRPASAILLAGWCALAPLGGALRWRPHIWLTGGAGSGKTTILDAVLYLMNGCAVYAQGNSTEAGIRQTLKTDAIPVMFDESEQNNDREVLRIQNILSMIRQSSTESDAKTLKGTTGGDAQIYDIRSMFCLSSIQVGMKHQADVERVSVLALKPKSEAKGQASENWRKIQAAIADLKASPDLPARLMRRSIDLLPVTLKNIGVFSQAAAEAFGTQRDGDQYGTMMAGAWSLFRDRPATLEEARAMIARYDWSDYLEGQEVDESEKALSALLGKLVRFKHTELSVYELIAAATNRPTESVRTVDADDAKAQLLRYGLRVEYTTSNLADARLMVAYSDNVPELAKLMADSPYATDLKGQLLRVKGAERTATVKRFLAAVSRAVSIPMTRVFDDLGEPELDPFGEDMPF